VPKLQHHLALPRQVQAVLRDRGTKRVPAQAFELGPIARRHTHSRVEVIAPPAGVTRPESRRGERRELVPGATANRLCSRSRTERATSLHRCGRDVREHRLGLEPWIGLAAVSDIVRHAATRQQPPDAPVDREYQPVHLLVGRRHGGVKAQPALAVVHVNAVEHERMHVHVPLLSHPRLELGCRGRRRDDVAPEASNNYLDVPYTVLQGRWTNPLTNKLLLEAGATYYSYRHAGGPPSIPPASSTSA
jgi:hypothetical protein